MAARRASLTRSSSSNSSALSNIDVHTKTDDHTAANSDHVSRVSASTPPTSLGDNGSLGSNSSRKACRQESVLDLVGEDNDSETRTIRPRRNRSSNISTYNIKKLSDAQIPLVKTEESRMSTAKSSRNISGLTGRTLVDGVENDEGDEDSNVSVTPTAKRLRDATNGNVESSAAIVGPRRSPRAGVQRQSSVKDRLKKAAGKAVSVLGKRSRDVMQAGKRTLGMTSKPSVEDEKQKKMLKELDTGPKGLLDELDLDAEFPAPRPTKKVKTSVKEPARDMAPPLILPNAESAGKRMKKWQKEGLYVGQKAGPESGQRRKLQKPRPGSSASEAEGVYSNNPPFLPLPMFSYLDAQRDFVIPYDVFAPTLKRGDEKPKDWTQVNRNRLVGEAKELWEKSERLPVSMCVCPAPEGDDLGCDEQCLNHIMQYECNEDNCGLSAAQCGNRAFAELAKRTKKGGSFDVGVEVLKTPNRGFGVRSCRTFAPGQIIMEYTGEIISEGECQRRMRELYMNKQSYYLMELERGLIIDGTKGSMARFINHSCAPNCEVRMVKVNGTPRMGVFAGESGIATGEELTYDYNFDNFGAARQKCYCGASTCRGFLSKRLNATEQKKLAKEENEKKRKAAEEAVKHAEDEDRKKRIKTDRGASWRGWVAVDDPETKERLKREKKEREEVEKNSVRAQRLAARRNPPPAKGTAKSALVVKRDASRRKTTEGIEATGGLKAEEARNSAISDAVPVPTVGRHQHTRTISTVSKSHEDLKPSRSSSRASHTSGITITKNPVGFSDAVTPTYAADVDDSTPSVLPKLMLEDDQTKDLQQKQKRSSILGDVKDSMKSLGKSAKSSLSSVASSLSATATNTVPKMKQSTLSFAKKLD